MEGMSNLKLSQWQKDLLSAFLTCCQVYDFARQNSDSVDKECLTIGFDLSALVNHSIMDLINRQHGVLNLVFVYRFNTNVCEADCLSAHQKMSTIKVDSSVYNLISGKVDEINKSHLIYVDVVSNTEKVLSLNVDDFIFTMVLYWLHLTHSGAMISSPNIWSNYYYQLKNEGFYRIGDIVSLCVEVLFYNRKLHPANNLSTSIQFYFDREIDYMKKDQLGPDSPERGIG